MHFFINTLTLTLEEIDILFRKMHDDVRILLLGVSGCYEKIGFGRLENDAFLSY